MNIKECMFQYLPSPSRLLSMMDPLLHMGIVLRCVAGMQPQPFEPETSTRQDTRQLTIRQLVARIWTYNTYTYPQDKVTRQQT